MTSLLDIDNLEVEFSTRSGVVRAVRGISLSLEKGQTVGLVGESGSGKTVTAYAISRLLERAGRISGGRILFKGRDLAHMAKKDLRNLRGAAVSMIFQNPRAALNPVRRIGQQIADAVRAHRDISESDARACALDLLRAVLIHDPQARINAYPHELSGGMCQRVMIAIAIACEPELMIADEPTTGLDVTTQKAVMDLLTNIVSSRGMSMILITHDLGLAAQYCQRMNVMERGLIVESGETGQLFLAPQHPYTRKLVAASPTPQSTIADLSRAAAAAGEIVSTASRIARMPADPAKPPLLRVEHIGKKFGSFQAVNKVSFSIPEGGSLGLVGESGSGKTTLSRIVCRLIDASEGGVIFDGENIGSIPSRDFHKAPHRRDIQMVFQDPNDSLNPRFSAFDSIAHPLRRLEGIRDALKIRDRVQEIADRVGLPLDLLDRFPHQLSGGQKARVGIARAIIVRPRLLVLDEPTAALDVSVQAIPPILLDRLRKEDGMAVLFVSHDLNVVRMMCETIVVLRRGEVVETGDASLFSAPKAQYTRELLDAIPHFEPKRVHARTHETGLVECSS